MVEQDKDASFKAANGEEIDLEEIFKSLNSDDSILSYIVAVFCRAQH
jgi:hypothetical protein